MIPIRTDVARKRPTVITYWIMGLCTAMFMASTVMENRAPEAYAKLFQFAALHGDFEHAFNQKLNDPLFQTLDDQDQVGATRKIDLGAVNPARPWQYITYQFMHGSWMHLLGNMLFLWVFGPVVEDRMRRWWFLAFYLGAGAFAGMVHSVFEGIVFSEGGITSFTYVPVIGASGSIAGVTGAFLVLFPQSRIDIIWFIGLIGRFSIPAWWFIGFAVARDFLFQAVGSDGVAHWAHIGGYVFGASVALIGLATQWIPREPYNLFTLGKQAHRRRAYRELVRKHGSQYLAEAAAAIVATPAEDRRAAQRAAVFQAITAGDLDAAGTRFATLLEDSPDEVLPRDQQLVMANHWFAAGRYALAAKAYEGVLKRYPDDSERHETALMLALTCARYLNDPIRASELLRGLNRETLSPEHAALADTLRTEIM